MTLNDNSARSRAAQACMTVRPPKEKCVYLAGPIAKSGWREKIVPALRDACLAGDTSRSRAFDPNATLPTITNDVVCGGPLFVACDHGCAHGKSSHGIGATSAGCFEDDFNALVHVRRRRVADVSVERIRCIDAVFAYFDRDFAYGSCWELGYAHALKIPIYVGFSPNLRTRDDHWFLLQNQIIPGSINIGNVRYLWGSFVRLI